MYHSITFNQGYTVKSGQEVPINEKNTWDDWHLIPVSRPLVNPPAPKTSFVEIPGADGTLDLTTAMTGRPMYGDRTGSWSFYVENGFKPWSSLFSEIMMYLQGKQFQARLEDDSGYYYEGRFWVNEWRSDPARSMITISYQVGPYKLYETNRDRRWLWDTFYFGRPYDVIHNTGDSGDEIINYKNLPVTSSAPLTLKVKGSTFDVIPTIEVLSISSTAKVKMQFGGVTYTLDSKKPNSFEDVIIVQGDNTFKFTIANGKAVISLNVVGGLL